ncbi:MAG: hypothetical protein WCI57_00895 [Candidatus Berkelbacteria bacterium]
MNTNTVNSTKTVEDRKVAFAAMAEDFDYLLASFARFMGFARKSSEMKLFEAYLFCLREKMSKGICFPVVSVALSALIGNAQNMEHALSNASNDESRAALLAEFIHNKTEGLLNASEWLSNESKTWSDPITKADAENLLSELFEIYYSQVSVLEAMTILQLISP